MISRSHFPRVSFQRELTQSSFHSSSREARLAKVPCTSGTRTNAKILSPLDKEYHHTEAGPACPTHLHDRAGHPRTTLTTCRFPSSAGHTHSLLFNGITAMLNKNISKDLLKALERRSGIKDVILGLSMRMRWSQSNYIGSTWQPWC